MVKEMTIINNEKIIELLLCTELFKSFDHNEVIKWLKENTCKISFYNKNEIIHIQNEKCNFMDIIIEGKLSVQKIDESGNILTIASFSSNSMIGGNLLFSKNNTYPMTIICNFPCTVFHFSKNLVLQLCQTNKYFLSTFLSSLSDKTLLITDKLNSLTMKTIRERIVDYLIYEYHKQQSTIIKLETSKKELAEKFGIQRPSLSRELNKMRKNGLIDFDAHTITIKNMNMLDRKSE